MMDKILFEILKCVVIISTLLITRYLVPYLAAKIKDTRYADFVKTVKDAVQFAEQTIGAGNGAEKKIVVVNFLTQLAKEYNLSITPEQINVLIESAVFAMKEGK